MKIVPIIVNCSGKHCYNNYYCLSYIIVIIFILNVNWMSRKVEVGKEN